MHFLSVRLLAEPVGSCFLIVDGQHGFAIRPSVWLVPPTLPPYLGVNEGIGLLGIDFLGCWSW